MASLSLYLITGCGTLAGLGLWRGMLIVNKARRLPTRQLLTVTLAVGLICRAAFSLLTPAFNSPDERPHFEYVKYLAEQHSFPISITPIDEYFQPPLYYLLLTPFYWLMHALAISDRMIVRILRIFSIFIWGLTVFLTFRFLKGLSLGDDFVEVFIVSMVALLPTYTFLSSVLNNDSLILTIGAGILSLLVRRKPSLKCSALIGVVLGLGLLTKLTAIVFVPLIAIMLLVRLRKTHPRTILLNLSFSLLPAVLISAPWAWRTWALYGTLSGVSGTVPFPWRKAIPAIWGNLEEINKTFWAVSGTYNNVSSFYPEFGKFLLYFSLAGLFFGLLFERKRLTVLVRRDVGLMVASTAAILINLILVLILLYNQGQGRYLFPLLIPISLLMAVGLRVFSLFDAATSRIHLSGFFITYALSFTCFSLSFMRLYP